MGEILMVLVTAERPRGLDPNIVRPGWLALGIAAALGVAVFLLSKSLAKHAKKAAQPWEDEDDHAPTSQASRRDDAGGQEGTPSDPR